MDYQNGKIYRVVSTNGLQYVGSTTQPLVKRKSVHIKDYKKWKQGKKRFTSVNRLLDDDNEIDIILIENYPCETKEQLHSRERYWIENIQGGCVNIYIPTRTREEYRETNKQHLKNWYTTEIQCECGRTIRKGTKARHLRSQIHQTLMNNQTTK